MPGVTGVHIDRALTNISIYYRNNAFVGDRLAPAVKVNKESDKYFVYGKENFNIPDAFRADKTATREITFTLSTDLYFCEAYGYNSKISDRERENSDEPLRPDIDTTELVTDCLLLDREYRTASKVLDSTNPEWGAFAGTHFTSLANKWDNLVEANPRNDVYFAKFMIFKDSRKNANSIFLPVECSYRLQQMEMVDELRKYTESGLLTNSGIPSTIWGLKVYDCESSYNSAAEGQDTQFTETFGNNVIISYINPSATGLKTLTFALTMQKRPFQTKKWREETYESDVVEVTHLYDIKIVAPACGFVFTDAIEQTV